MWLQLPFAILKSKSCTFDFHLFVWFPDPYSIRHRARMPEWRTGSLHHTASRKNDRMTNRILTAYGIAQEWQNDEDDRLSLSWSVPGSGRRAVDRQWPCGIWHRARLPVRRWWPVSGRPARSAPRSGSQRRQSASPAKKRLTTGLKW